MRTLNYKKGDTNLMKELDEYWICIIGPTKRSEHPHNGETPLRMAIKDTFYKVFGRNAKECASRFGLLEEEKKQIEKIQMKAFLKRINNDY